MSQWGRLLLDEIERTSVEHDSAVAWSIGGAGIVIKTPGSTILIDPFFGSTGSSDWVRMIPVPLDPGEMRSATCSCQPMNTRIIARGALLSRSPRLREPFSSGRSPPAAGSSNGALRKTG